MRRPVLFLTASAPATTRLTLDGLVTAADAASRTLTGRVVQYGATGTTSAGPVRFAAGSLTASDPRRIKLLVEHDPGRVVGYATQVDDVDGHLVATFHLPAGPLGDEVLSSAALGLRDGLSVGVEVNASDRAADGVLDVTAAAWRETSVCAMPAFAGSLVTHVAASTPPAPVPPPPSPAAPLPVIYATSRPTSAPVTDWREVPQRIAAAWKAGGTHAALTAALGDVLLPTVPGERDAMMRPAWLGELWTAHKFSRPLIEAFGVSPLTTYKVMGFTKQRPAFGVAPYTGNKTAVPSTGTYKYLPNEATAQRVAGAHDIDRIIWDLGDGSFMQSYFESQAENYAVLTESLVAATLLAAATELPEAAGVLAGLNAAAVALGEIGASLSFVKVSSDLWGELFSITTLDAPWLFGGTANITDGTATIGNITIATEPSLPAATLLAGDRRAATYFEKSPPLQITAVDLANGGVDLGLFGYYALLVNDPAAILSIPVGPPALASYKLQGPAGPAGPPGPKGDDGAPAAEARGK